MPASTAKSRHHTRLFAVGTGLWTLGLAVLLILDVAEVLDAGRWPWVCLLGIALGITGIVYARLSWRAR